VFDELLLSITFQPNESVHRKRVCCCCCIQLLVSCTLAQLPVTNLKLSLCGVEWLRAWEQGNIPEDWWKGIILPFYKGKGSRHDCHNYRGITLLSVPGKVFAHVLLARVKSRLHDHRRIEQSGFTSKRSTIDRIWLSIWFISNEESSTNHCG